MPTATIIGSGPNGLSAAIVLATARVSTTVFERNVQIGCDSSGAADATLRSPEGSAHRRGMARLIERLAEADAERAASRWLLDLMRVFLCGYLT
jgi:flavin-dependent dehydrogenase